MNLGLESTYATDLEGFSVPWKPDKAPAPRLLFWNRQLARDLDLPLEHAGEGPLAELFSGNELPDDAVPVAQAYAGHQFGHFSPRLGDGRAMLLGEINHPSLGRFDLAFKGSGPTPFSRGGDGKAAVGPMLREVVVSEFLQAVGIPTTRALAVVATGEEVMRDTVLPGAVLTRVGSSHIRVGTFEFFAARGDVERVRKLAEYAIARHDPDLVGRDDRFLAFLERVARRQASLVARWLNVGFIHGVLNTDNVAVSGESIDFGPCAFLEGYDPSTVFSSIDRGGRYAFGNQPTITQWNLGRLCSCFLPLLHPDGDQATRLAIELVERFEGFLADDLQTGRLEKLGLVADPLSKDEDALLAADWISLLQRSHADFTLAWRSLADAAGDDDASVTRLLGGTPDITEWLARWRTRLARHGSQDDHPITLREANPLYIPRNHLVEEVLAAASDHGDLAPLAALLEALRDPFTEREGMERFSAAAPAEVTACYRTFCGT
jgi:uncharacterized protein YdiU (UPF0061 family)